MTKEEQNDIIKQAWVRSLQAENDIPEDIGETYKAWLQGKIKQATQQMMTTDSGNQQTQAQIQQTQAQQTEQSQGENR